MSTKWSSLFRLALVGCLAGSLGFLSLFLSRSDTKSVSPQAPRLVVLVVFDQLRADYLERWQTLFEDDGFRRLQEQGAWFQNCHYPDACTLTASGHASILTGCSPDTHGIVGND